MDCGIVHEEQIYLDKVYASLRADIEDRTRGISSRKNEIMDIRRYINENIYILDPEELAQNVQSIHNLDAIHTLDEKALGLLLKTLQKPYFAKIVFRGNGKTNTLRIGLHGYRADHVEYVIDWRAPVSQLYYDADIGQASFEVQGKAICVDLLDKQHIILSGGRVVDVYSDSALVSDEILRQVLSQNSNPFMHQLVETLQRNQNQIIRSKSNRNLFISGPAGSGKTVVAMHRIAYMMYSYRNTNKSFGILFIAPHDSFLLFAKNIVPELTGEQIEMATMDSLFGLTLGAGVESRMDYYERYITADIQEQENMQNRVSPSTLQQIRKVMVAALTRNILLHGEARRFLNSATFWNLLNKKNTKYSLVDVVQNYLLDRGMHAQTANSILSELSRLNLQELICMVLPDFGKQTNAGFQRYDDFYVLEYAKCVLHGVPCDPSIQHIVLDEVQDVTYIQYYLLSKMYQASKTLVGDPNQCVLPMDLGGFLDDVDEMVLDMSYRSTQEIMHLANALLSIKESKVFMRNGALPLLVVYDCEETLLDYLLHAIDEDRRAIVLTATNREAVLWEEKLVARAAMQGRVHKALCAAFYSVRGMEYDQVFVVDSEVFHKERRYLYMAVTRALHEVALCVPQGCKAYDEFVRQNLMTPIEPASAGFRPFGSPSDLGWR